MTLRAVFNKEQTKSIKDTMADELTVYKAAVIIGKRGPSPKYFSPIIHKEYKGGVQMSLLHDLIPFSVAVADEPHKHRFYYPGFHSFANKQSAEKLLKLLCGRSKEDAVLLTCGVLKKWIIAIGIEGDRDMVVVSNRILIPSYPHTDIMYDNNCEWFYDAATEKIGWNAYLKEDLPLSSYSAKLSYPAGSIFEP